jgi:hypothetical protein
MIENAQQFETTRAQWQKFVDALEEYRSGLKTHPESLSHLHPRSVQAVQESMQAVIHDLWQELTDYRQRTQTSCATCGAVRTCELRPTEPADQWCWCCNKCWERLHA